MMIYLPRYISKVLVPALAIIILFIFALTVLANFFLASSKTKIENNLSECSGQKLAIDRIHFLPPNLIILKNLSVFQDEISEGNQLISIQTTRLGFSLKNFITKRDFVVTDACFNKPKIDLSGYGFLPKELIEKIWGLIKSLKPGQSFDLVIKDGLLILSREGGLGSKVVIDNISNIESGKFLSSRGSITMDSKTKALDYDFHCSLTKDGMIIDSIEFRKESLYLKLWGNLSNNLLRLNGNLLSSVHFIETESFIPLSKITDKIKKILTGKDESVPQMIGAPALRGLNILDLHCLIKFLPHTVKIEIISFSLDDIPFCLKGIVSFAEPANINLKLSSFANQPQEKRLRNPNRFDIELTGAVQNARFNGALTLDFLRKTKYKESLEKAEIIFKNLALNSIGYSQFKISCEETDLFYTTGENLYKLFFKDFNASFGAKGDLKYVDFSSVIYDGFLEGKGAIKMTHMPFESTFDINIRDISANQLSSVVIYLSRVYGKFNSQIHYTNYPSSNLKGKLLINNGYLDNLKFFDWLADFFSLPALRKVDFKNISADFLVNDEVAGLENISLESENVSLDGYFNVSGNDLVSGKLSLILSDELLNTSPKFKSLLRLLGDKVSLVSFDFQMSGLLEAMNFKWLESDFKKGLDDLLSVRMEKRLESKIEKALAPISAK